VLKFFSSFLFKLNKVFEIIDRISDTYKVGRGAYANVYRAKMHSIGQIIIKIPDIDDHFFYYHTKLREALLNKNNFGVPFRGLILENNRYKGFASSVASCSLNKLKNLNSRKILSVAKDLSQFLAKFHSLGLIHGDIKPANILMLDQKAVFCDFGLSMWTTQRNPIKHKHSDVIYTPNYRPPELFMKGPWTIESSMDIWALGMTLYSLICSTGHCALGNTDDVKISLEKTFPLDFDECKKYILGLIAEKTNYVNHGADDIILSDLISMCIRFEPSERVTAEQIFSVTQHFQESLEDDISSIFLNLDFAIGGPTSIRESPLVQIFKNENKEVRPFQAEICSSICRKIFILLGIDMDITLLGAVLKLFEIFGNLWSTNARSTYATILPIMLCKSSNIFQLSWLIKIAGISYFQFEEEFHEALAISICDSSWSSFLWPTNY
jgi:serine/threonine protein kinase